MLSRIAVVAILASLILACGAVEREQAKATELAAPTATARAVATATSQARRSESAAITSAILSIGSSSGGSSSIDPASTIQGYPEVVTATDRRSGNDVFLNIVVEVGTSKARAQQLGDNFIRMYKGAYDEKPGATIGTGKYAYTVAIHDANKREIARGGKVAGNDWISW